jgi:uncharacterized protein YjbJ (UPF0337 family)
MNKDHIKGAAKDIAGKVQREFGEATGDLSNQAKGAAKQAEGKVQKKFGDVKDAADDARDESRDIERDA